MSKAVSNRLSRVFSMQNLAFARKIADAQKHGWGPIFEAVWIFLEEPGSSWGATIYAIVFSLCIMLSVLCTGVMTLEPPLVDFRYLAIADLFFDCNFAF